MNASADNSSLQLEMEEVNVGFEAISCPHFDGEEVMSTLLCFLTSSILCKKGFSYLREVVERAR